MARSVSDAIDSLPHWARVGFAARCARNILPLFERAWPDAAPRRPEALRRAIGLAEQSAAEGIPAAELHAAIVAAIMTAGAALLPLYGMSSSDEPGPAGEPDCQVASFAAKAAEWAAKAAAEAPSGSAHAALEAYTWARDAADLAGAGDVWDRLDADFANLRRAAARGRWSDATPVPPSVLDRLREGPPEQPWWAFWR